VAAGEGRPVVSGLVALVAVAVVVGLVLGGGALVASRVLGLGDSEASTETTVADSMYLPTPSETPVSTEPAITLAPGDETREPSESPSESESPEDGISLQAGQTEVSAMERIDLTGTYPGGEGAVLQVERAAGEGGWTEFEVTVPVSGETFSTYVQTGQPGLNKFRLRDPDTDLVSNVVEVTIG
jgi:hypothetical protein